MFTALDTLAAAHGLYTQNLYPIILRYVLSEYSTVDSRSADIHDIG